MLHDRHVRFKPRSAFAIKISRVLLAGCGHLLQPIPTAPSDLIQILMGVKAYLAAARFSYALLALATGYIGKIASRGPRVLSLRQPVLAREISPGPTLIKMRFSYGT